ncbi:nucleoporin [Intoshia linei]|uniref:Nuclear pore protein n=1 Tax=Intoshia linei TaxID=1819745 RepID=A0A177B793_9BILA|nr:nucleoporin [Intoshia linei]
MVIQWKEPLLTDVKVNALDKSELEIGPNSILKETKIDLTSKIEKLTRTAKESKQKIELSDKSNDFCQLPSLNKNLKQLINECNNLANSCRKCWDADSENLNDVVYRNNVYFESILPKSLFDVGKFNSNIKSLRQKSVIYKEHVAKKAKIDENGLFSGLHLKNCLNYRDEIKNLFNLEYKNIFANSVKNTIYKTTLQTEKEINLLNNHKNDDRFMSAYIDRTRNVDMFANVGLYEGNVSNNLLKRTIMDKNSNDVTHVNDKPFENFNNLDKIYFEALEKYNFSAIDTTDYPTYLSYIFEKLGTINNENEIDFWQLIHFITNNERLKNCSYSGDVVLKILDSTISHLEISFLNYINHSLKNRCASLDVNILNYNLSNQNDVIRLIVNFILIKMSSSDQIVFDTKEGLIETYKCAPWPLIYFCLRCRIYPAVLNIISDNLTIFGRQFLNIVKHYMENNCILDEHKSHLTLMLHRDQGATSLDPYKVTTIMLLLEEKNSSILMDSFCFIIEDIFWYRLSIYRSKLRHLIGSVSDATEITFSSMQQLRLNVFDDILNNEKEYMPIDEPFICARNCVYMMNYFDATKYLNSHYDFLRLAVQYVLVIWDLKLYKIDESQENNIQESLNKTILPYARLFDYDYPAEAVHYYKFLSKYQQIEVVRDIILKQKSAIRIIGRIGLNGVLRNGLLQQLNFDVKIIIESSASEFVANGQVESALQLYEIGGLFKDSVELLIKILTPLITNPKTDVRTNHHKVATLVAERYKSNGYHIDDDIICTFYFILDLMTFFDTYNEGKYTNALEIIKRIKLIPLTSSYINEYLGAFNKYSNKIYTVMPALLLATMKSIYMIYSDDVTNTLGIQMNGNILDKKSQLRDSAAALIKFSGLIPYRIPADTLAKLVQIEVQMN